MEFGAQGLRNTAVLRHILYCEHEDRLLVACRTTIEENAVIPSLVTLRCGYYGPTLWPFSYAALDHKDADTPVYGCSICNARTSICTRRFS